MIVKLFLVLGNKLDKRKEFLNVPSQQSKVDRWRQHVLAYGYFAIKGNLGKERIQDIDYAVQMFFPLWVVGF